MKRTSIWVIICMLLCLTAGCGERESVELIVFGAASLTETLTTLGDRYVAEHPDVEIVFNFDSSGTLKTQIQEGAACDIFISAGQKQMDQLDGAADAEQNCILEGSRLDLLENKVVLAVPEDNPSNIGSFDDLAAGLKSGRMILAMGNADVPVGQYTRKILEYYGLSETELQASGAVTYGSNVREVTIQISEGTVDCGIIYQTDAYTFGLTAVDVATEEMCGRVIYPAALLQNARNSAAAQDFLAYLTGDVGDAVFSAVGFTPVE